MWHRSLASIDFIKLISNYGRTYLLPLQIPKKKCLYPELNPIYRKFDQGQSLFTSFIFLAKFTFKMSDLQLIQLLSEIKESKNIPCPLILMLFCPHTNICGAINYLNSVIFPIQPFNITVIIFLVAKCLKYVF